VTSWQSLHSAWRALFRRTRPKSRNTEGLNRSSINHFAVDSEGNIRKLARNLRAGRFAFEKLRPHLIPKPSGKDRLICVPTVEDRIVQGVLLSYLSDRYGARFANPISYGFVKGRKVKEAATRACVLRQEHQWIFKTDITSFFDRIPREDLAVRIRRVIREKSLHPLLIAAAECEVFAPNPNIQKRIHALGIVEGRGIRQGMPLSPFFANLYLEPVDAAIMKAQHAALRYADDLIFFGDSEAHCLTIFEFCRKELSAICLDIPDIGPESKSRIFSPAEPAEFLGLGLCPKNATYELRLLPAQIQKIRKTLLDLASVSELLSRNITLGFLGSTVAARVGGYISAYECCTNLKELENALDDVEQKVLRTVYRDLMIDVSALSAEKRTFLGLH